MYKIAITLYFICFSLYLLFSRVPDFFDAEIVPAYVSKAGFSSDAPKPQLLIPYNVGQQTFEYKTNKWFLHNYKVGEKVEIIYNPVHPKIASLFAFIGYWINWGELIFTFVFFFILFFAAKSITGHKDQGIIPGETRKRKYDE